MLIISFNFIGCQAGSSDPLVERMKEGKSLLAKLTDFLENPESFQTTTPKKTSGPAAAGSAGNTPRGRGSAQKLTRQELQQVFN